MKQKKFPQTHRAASPWVIILLGVSLVSGTMTLIGQQPSNQITLTPADVQALNQLRAQQKEILANMKKIEDELALAAEDIRQARIFSSRGGR